MHYVFSPFVTESHYGALTELELTISTREKVSLELATVLPCLCLLSVRLKGMLYCLTE